MTEFVGLGDPLYTHGVHWAELLVVVNKVLVAVGALGGGAPVPGTAQLHVIAGQVFLPLVGHQLMLALGRA